MRGTKIKHQINHTASGKKTRFYFLVLIFVLATFFISPKAFAYSVMPQNVIELTNQVRLQNGLEELQESAALSQAAYNKAKDMVEKNYWSHTTIEGYPFWFFVNQTNYSWQRLGENIAANFKTAEGVVSAWLASYPHRKNILNPSYQNIGVGKYQNIVVAYYGSEENKINYKTKIYQFVSFLTWHLRLPFGLGK